MPEARVSYTVHVAKGWKATDVAVYVDRAVRRLYAPSCWQLVAAIQQAPGVKYVSLGKTND